MVLRHVVVHPTHRIEGEWLPSYMHPSLVTNSCEECGLVLYQRKDSTPEMFVDPEQEEGLAEPCSQSDEGMEINRAIIAAEGLQRATDQEILLEISKRPSLMRQLQ